MKVAALIPFKNEALNLPNCLNSIKDIVDFVIGYDDSSKDNSRAVFDSFGGIILDSKPGLSFSTGDEKVIREMLLAEAQRLEATIFFFIDADEVVSNYLKINFRSYCASLLPGQAAHINWVNLANDGKSFFPDGGPFQPVYKSFLIRDDGTLTYRPPGKDILHFSRVPNSENLTPPIAIPSKDGSILHLQHLDQDLYMAKQIRYKCLEMVHETSNPFQINDNYAFTLNKAKIVQELPAYYQARDLVFTANELAKNDIYQEIFSLLQDFGVEYFEKLDIWHVKTLREFFEAETGRSPREFRFSKFMRKIKFKIVSISGRFGYKS